MFARAEQAAAVLAAEGGRAPPQVRRRGTQVRSRRLAEGRGFLKKCRLEANELRTTAFRGLSGINQSQRAVSIKPTGFHLQTTGVSVASHHITSHLIP
jgi:hypothetical protein